MYSHKKGQIKQIITGKKTSTHAVAAGANSDESDGAGTFALTTPLTVATSENYALHDSAATNVESCSASLGAYANLNAPAGAAALPPSAPATTPPSGNLARRTSTSASAHPSTSTNIDGARGDYDEVEGPQGGTVQKSEASETGELFPRRHQVRERVSFKNDTGDEEPGCSKQYRHASSHSPGSFTVFCACHHPKLLGILVMR